MKEIQFFVPGPPQGKARARTVQRNGVTRSFTPEKTVLYENLIKGCFLEEYGRAGTMFADWEPVSIQIIAQYVIPKRATRKEAAAMAVDDILPTKKPDVDNIAKAVADALNGIAYKDDAQVTDLSVKKRYAAGGEEGLLVTLSEA